MADMGTGLLQAFKAARINPESLLKKYCKMRDEKNERK